MTDPRPAISDPVALRQQIARLAAKTPYPPQTYRCRVCSDARWVELTDDNVVVVFGLDQGDLLDMDPHEDAARLAKAEAAIGSVVPCQKCNPDEYERWRTGALTDTSGVKIR